MAKQMKIPGTEGKQVVEINQAGEHYVKQRDKRMSLSKKEKEAKVALIAAMRKHGVENYRDDEASPPIHIVVSSKDDVKVTQVNPDAGGDEGEEPEAQA